VRNSEGTDAQRGTRFGGLGRVLVESTMSRTVSNSGSMLVLLERDQLGFGLLQSRVDLNLGAMALVYVMPRGEGR
jgi:hypothetical protein